MKRILSLLLLSLLILPLASCAAPRSAFAPGEGIKIAATLFPQYDFARIIGGDRVQAVKLLPAGTESHTYEPTASDLITLSDADLFLYTGPDMEPWAETVLSGLDKAPRALDLSTVTESAPSDHGHDHDHDGHGHEIAESDPHIWTSPANAMEMVTAIRDALISIDPEGEATYIANASAYLTELSALDASLTALARESEGKTLVFGGRFAFAHLTSHYGFSYLSAYRGCDVEAQPSASDLATVIDFVRQNKIAYIFKEEMVAPQSVATIAAETGAKPLLLHSCHNVTEEELAEGVSYLSLMRENLKNLELTLGVTAGNT